MMPASSAFTKSFMMYSGIRKVRTAKIAARLTVSLTMMQMVFRRAAIAFSGSFSRMPQ